MKAFGVGDRSAAEQALEQLLEELVESELFSAVSAGVARDGDTLWLAHAGSRNGEPGGPLPGPADGYDLASITKPFSASLALRLHEDKDLLLTTPIGELWPGIEGKQARVPLESLLRHRAGLRAWLPLYSLCETALGAPTLLLEPRWWDARVGTYSDLGFVLWRYLVERALDRPFAELMRERLLDPLRLGATFLPPGRRTVICTIDTAREVELATEAGLPVELLPAPPRGTAQDGNARFLGGISGHAGLFGRVPDLLRLGEVWITEDELVDEETRRAALAGKGRWRLGWSNRRTKGDGGPALTAEAFGHTGFTGGSLFVDPGAPGAKRGAVFVLLGHRRSPSSSLAPARRRFHRAAVDLLEERG